MAGLYADVPGVRVPYHVDGTSVRWATTYNWNDKTITSQWTALSGADIQEINDGDVTDVGSPWGAAGNNWGRYYAWTFPQPITILGHNLVCSKSGGGDAQAGLFEYSTDTTDGSDGNWTTSASNPDLQTGSALRSITTVSWSNVRGIRLHVYQTGGSTTNFLMRDCAFFGTWTPITLCGWHPTLDQIIPPAQLDFGDIALGTNVVKQFRIKNGRTQQANNTVVSAAAGNTQLASGLTFSLDGSTYTTTITVPTIAAGAITPVLYVKRTVGAGEAVGNIGITPITFVPGSWT